MVLSSGSRLGNYEILEPLGVGGMGEVYRARDHKLDRDVALKVLPEAFASDRDRMARFEREAKVLASLNHHHIASIYGLEEAGSTRALVMEVVEGPTLAERIEQGPIPIDEAIVIARQIAEALEYAHERSIIHRDLKPANLKLTEEGDVKLLDFGLAKALEGDVGKAQDDSHSPTLTRATEAGVLLGTAGYMSPEQAKGKPVDRRADIWAFGVVLFEMLTGRRLFAGETASETLAFVMTKEPSFDALPSGTPASVRELLRRCLTQDPRMRLQAIGEARVALSAPAEEANEIIPAQRAAFMPWVVAAVCAGVAIVALLPRAETLEAPVRLNVELGRGLSQDWSHSAATVLSPDGSTLAFVARKGGEQSSQLFVRRLDQPQAMALAGTEGADGPFFSPDGEWIGFFVGGSLRKIQVTGGASMTLADVPFPRGAWWGDNGIIALAPNVRSGLMKISTSGGELEPLTELDETEHEITHRWPQILPGGKVVLFTAAARGGDYNNANVVAQSLETGERQIVQRGGFHARYLPSGHIIYLHDATLFTARFDPEQLAIRGERRPIVEGVASSISGGAQFAVSETGTLVYSHGSTEGGVALQWMQRDGSFELIRDVVANYQALMLSPDGSRLALSITGAQTDIWVYELQRGTMSRLTFNQEPDYAPIWTSDGTRIVFGSNRNEKTDSVDIYWKSADGTGDAQLLLESEYGILPHSWHPGGNLLAYSVQNLASRDIFILPVQDDESDGLASGEPQRLLTGPFIEDQAQFSPDGRFIAYTSNESGQFEVYVRPFPASAGRWQISTDGGVHPEWSPNGQELFYRWTGSTPQMMVVGYSVDGDTFIPETPAPWSDGRFIQRGTFRSFSLHPDGNRFAVFNAQEDVADSDHVMFVFNFFDELERLTPTER